MCHLQKARKGNLRIQRQVWVPPLKWRIHKDALPELMRADEANAVGLERKEAPDRRKEVGWG